MKLSSGRARQDIFNFYFFFFFLIYGLCKIFYLFIWLCWVLIVVCRIFYVVACRIFRWGLWILLVVACDLEFPGQELNPGPVLGAWSLSHWTTREVPSFCFLWKFIEQMMVKFIRANEGRCWHCYWTKLKSVHPVHSKAKSVDAGLKASTEFTAG